MTLPYREDKYEHPHFSLDFSAGDADAFFCSCPIHPQTAKFAPTESTTSSPECIYAQNNQRRDYGECHQIKVTLQTRDLDVQVQNTSKPESASSSHQVTVTPKKKSGWPGVGIESKVESPSVPDIPLLQETVQASGNHLGLGCKYSVSIPNVLNFGLPAEELEKAYLWAQVEGDSRLISTPTGWQNPLLLKTTSLHDTGRNLVVDIYDPGCISRVVCRPICQMLRSHPGHFGFLYIQQSQ